LALLVCAASAGAVEAFPKTLVFEPLKADPRWPAFSGTMQFYSRSRSNVVWAANFGESLPLVGNRGGLPWQFGLQAAVYTIWDLKTESNDLINLDFLVGFPYTWRRGRWSYMARIFHVSTHLGDEFLLANKDVGRVNLSYEALDGKVSYDFDHGFRAYGGAGRMIRKYPPEIKPLFTQLGGEWLGPTFAGGILRPFAGADFQKHQENGWGATGVSLRGGVQMQHRDMSTRRLQLLLEYYHGRDPNGQFYRNTVEEWGLGVHAYF
jgi:hypothetical protein